MVGVVVTALEIDWGERLVDAGLPFGFAVLSVPLRGGTEGMWSSLVDELQAASSVNAAGSGGFHLVRAERVADRGQLDLGLHLSGDVVALLGVRLRAAVERVNRAAGVR